MSNWVMDNKEFFILGLETPEEHISNDHSNRVSEGMLRLRDKKASATLSYLRTREQVRREGKTWAQHQWGSESLRYKRIRSKCKRLYRIRLEAWAYRTFGVLKPKKMKYRKARPFEEYELMMNFISQGWNPRTGEIKEAPEVRNKRWDLSEGEWLLLWSNFPERLRSQYRAVREDIKGPYSYDNMYLDKIPSKKV